MSQELLRRQIPHCVVETDLPYPKYRGKVRDRYEMPDAMLLVTTDRISAFDRYLTCIPFKGEVLNLLSAWWFKQTQSIIANHVLDLPSRNSMRVKKCKVLPVEVVVRGYLTGSTQTSIWTLYQKGERQFFSTTLPDGLKKNTALPQPILTPTSKSDIHDEPLTTSSLPQFIAPEKWRYVEQKALELFHFAAQRAASCGLILVDTKFEFGEDEQGNIILVDECLTPDSSRYWKLETYAKRLAAGQEPDSYDKEFIRLWYKQHCDPYRDKVLPEAPVELVESLAERYIEVYEKLSGTKFEVTELHSA